MLRFTLRALLGDGLLAGCVTVPSEPGVVVLPGAGKTFEQFRGEDTVCRHYAQDRVGATPEQAAADSVTRSAGTGALLGAAVGALIGVLACLKPPGKAILNHTRKPKARDKDGRLEEIAPDFPGAMAADQVGAGLRYAIV